MIPTARLPILFSVVLLLTPVAVLADAPIVRTFDVSAGGRLVLDTDRGKVEVRSGRSDAVRVEVERGSDSADEIMDDVDLTFSAEDNEVTINGRSRHRWWNVLGWRRNLTFVIEVPNDFDLQLETSGGSIEVESPSVSLGAGSPGGPGSTFTVTLPVEYGR